MCWLLSQCYWGPGGRAPWHVLTREMAAFLSLQLCHLSVISVSLTMLFSTLISELKSQKHRQGTKRPKSKPSYAQRLNGRWVLPSRRLSSGRFRSWQYNSFSNCFQWEFGRYHLFLVSVLEAFIMFYFPVIFPSFLPSSLLPSVSFLPFSFFFLLLLFHPKYSLTM